MTSIRTKLAVLVVTAVACAVLIASLAAAWRAAQHRFDFKRAELDAVSIALAGAIAAPLAQGDRAGVARALAAVGQIPGITYARVSDQHLHTVLEFGIGIVVTHAEPDAGSAIGPFSAAFVGTYPVTTPIVSSGRPIGHLALIADVSDLRSALLDSLAVSLLIGLLAAGGGLALSLRLQRRITAPISALTHAMDEIRRTQDFTHQVRRSSNDEIGLLVDSFNAMLAEIRTRDEALARHRQDLERKVEERTAELAGAKLAAEHANAAKSDFLATMSHEIRTPMNGMLVTAELLATSGLPPKLARHAEVIVHSGRHLLAIINDILDLSKIEAGKIELEAIPVSPASVVDDVLRLFAERASSKHLELSGYVSPVVPRRIAADPVRLGQILANLVSNALKFTDRGGVSIEMTARQDAGRDVVELCVVDTGPGIPQHRLAGIFDAFAQADQSTTRRYGGTGIGLTITRRIIDVMGGTIEVESELGAGSLFRVTIPVTVIEPPRPVLQAGHDSRIVVAVTPGQSHDHLLLALADRAFEIAVVSPDDLASDQLAAAGTRAVFVDADHLPRVAALSAPAFPAGPAIVALCRLGPGPQGHSEPRATATVVLDYPRATRDLAACLDAVVRGPEAVAAITGAGNPDPVGSDDTIAFPGARILAADDSALNREVLLEALSRLDIEVTCVEDGRAACEAVEGAGYDLVFMDGSMPVMDGFTAARHIRAREHETGRPRLPIVALTAHVVGGRADLWREAGMDDCVTKPFTLAMLRDCLARWLPDTCASRRPSPQASPPAALPQAAAQGRCEAAGLLDDAVLAGIRDMQRPGDDLVSRVIGLYRRHAPGSLETLRQRIAAGEAGSIADAAHALKSLSRNIGAVRVGDLAGGLELAARGNGDLASASAACDAIAAALAATLAALDAATPRSDAA